MIPQAFWFNQSTASTFSSLVQRVTRLGRADCAGGRHLLSLRPWVHNPTGKKKNMLAFRMQCFHRHLERHQKLDSHLSDASFLRYFLPFGSHAQHLVDNIRTGLNHQGQSGYLMVHVEKTQWINHIGTFLATKDMSLPSSNQSVAHKLSLQFVSSMVVSASNPWLTDPAEPFLRIAMTSGSWLWMSSSGGTKMHLDGVVNTWCTMCTLQTG